MWQIKDAGHQIIVITDRQFGTTPEVSHRATIEWWKEYGFPEYDEIHFSADKTCVQTDIFVEDKVSNFEAVNAVGTPCYLITRPWNEDHDAGSLRINDIIDYPSRVQQLHEAMSFDGCAACVERKRNQFA